MVLATDSPWQAVVAAALIGTDRQPFQPPSAPGGLGQVLAQLSHQPPEVALLATAATLSLHRRIGWLPTSAPPPTDAPCPVDDRPPCGPLACRFLQQMLLKREAQVLPEWLETVARSGQRLPESYLSPLLALGQKQKDLRPFILPVLGRRGLWLAAQNPDWHYGLPLTSAHWHTGSIEQRVAYLEKLRSQDPDQARTLLCETWPEEAAPDAPKLLEALRAGLRMADEPFLEAVLKDHRKKARNTAAHLLTYLPDSRLAQRMVARIQPLISLTVQDDKVGAISVTLPEVCDGAMEQDGIDPKPPKSITIGERAWWLQQILAATPLTYWEQQGELHDRVVVEAFLHQITGHEWRKPLHRGWLKATERQGNPRWSWAWLTYLDTLTNVGIDSKDVRWLMDNLTVEARQQWTAQASDWLLSVLAEDREPWSHDLTRLALENVLQTLNSPKGSTWYTFDMLKVAVLCIDPNFLPEATAICGQLQAEPRFHDYYEKELQKFLAILQFRQEMHQAFADP